MCLDAGNINMHSIPQYEIPMSIDSILGKITNAQIFTKIDLEHCFWLILVSTKWKIYTGFNFTEVLEVLDEAGLRINLENCHFHQSQVKFLEFAINIVEMKMAPDRTKGNKDYKRPHNLKKLGRFIGKMSIFQRLIPNLSNKEIHSVELLTKNVGIKKSSG